MNKIINQPVTSPDTVIEEYYNQFKCLGKRNSFLQTLNESALNQFKLIQWPHPRHEMFTFVNVKELVNVDYSYHHSQPEKVSSEIVQDHIYSGLEDSFLVFVDGKFNPELSNYSRLNDDLTVTAFDEVDSDSSVTKYLQESITLEQDVFSLLNTIFLTSGYVIDIKENTCLSNPLQILHISTGSSDKLVVTNPQLFVKIGDSSEVAFVVKTVGLDQPYFINSVENYVVGKEAKVDYTCIQSDNCFARNLTKTKIVLNEKSQFVATNALFGSDLTRHHFEACLKGEEGKIDWNSVSLLSRHEQVHHYIRVHHEATNCVSNQQFKNIVDDQSKVSVDTTVVVHEGAIKTVSNQLINNLALSEEVHTDVKPNLMIYADDVKCSHGATIGQVDEDQLLYLRTRGLATSQARKLLITGFVNSLMSTIKNKSVSNALKGMINTKLEGKL